MQEYIQHIHDDVKAKFDHIVHDFEKAIPGALKRNPEQVEQWLQEIPKDKNVVVYCIRGGSVSNSVVDKLLAVGMRANYIEGRWEAWKKSFQD